MSLESRSTDRFTEAPQEKPQLDRVEYHANLERPGAQFHPCAGSWKQPDDKFSAWRSR